jgi:hypothetical protein
MLAGALARLGRMEQADAVLAGLSGPQGGAAAEYHALAAAQKAGPAWDQRFRRFTGYHPDLLRRSCSLTYAVRGPVCRTDGPEAAFGGKGFHGSYRPPGEKGAGRLRIWLEASFPVGGLRVRRRLAPWSGQADSAVRLEVWGHNGRGSRMLASRRLKAGPRNRDGRFSLAFDNPAEGTRLEVRLDGPMRGGPRLRELSMEVDIQAHMRRMLRWYYDARGRTALAAERYGQAVKAFSALLGLDPEFSPSYLPAAEALLDSGQIQEAYAMALRAEKHFGSRPAVLERVCKLYKSLQKEKDVTRVEKRLEHLRPSLKREARFAGGLTLLGYDLSPAKLKPGAKLDMSFYWRCWSRPPLNYFIFVHLRGRGRTVTYDHLLDHGRRNMPALKIGQVVREDYKVTIPKDLAPGKYRLVAGLWDPHFTGKGVLVTGGEGQGTEEVYLANLEVTP